MDKWIRENFMLVIVSFLLGVMISQNIHLRKQVACWKETAITWINIAEFQDVKIIYFNDYWHSYYTNEDNAWKEEAETWKKSALVWKGIAEAREKHLTKEGLAEMGK